MTSFEKTQPNNVFVKAGKTAFMIGVPGVECNPYKLEPFHSLWEKGWRFAKRQWNEKFYKARQQSSVSYAVKYTTKTSPPVFRPSASGRFKVSTPNR